MADPRATSGVGPLFAGLREAIAAGDVYIVGAEDVVLTNLVEIAEAAFDLRFGEPDIVNDQLNRSRFYARLDRALGAAVSHPGSDA